LRWKKHLHRRELIRTETQKNLAETKSTPPDDSPDSLAGVHARVAAMPPIILGKDMADNLGASVGSVVLVPARKANSLRSAWWPKYSRFRVVGIFNSGFFDYDSSWAFTRLSDAQRLFGLGDLISVIEFKVERH